MGRKAYETFTCSCGERCTMVPNDNTGKLAPITIALSSDGNIDLIDRDLGVRLAHVQLDDRHAYRVVPKGEREANPGLRHLNHWSSCPDADRFRR